MDVLYATSNADFLMSAQPDVAIQKVSVVSRAGLENSQIEIVHDELGDYNIHTHSRDRQGSARNEI